jgi:pimeloyl-ACP methyl ester carboxylesterase
VSLVVQGVEVFVQQTGSGPPLLLAHGVPDTGRIWDEVLPRFATRYRCIVFDLPGFGRSRAPDDFDTSFGNLGRFLAELIAALGIDEPVSLLGHDYGGAFTMAFAALHPERVRRLVVSNHAFFVGAYTWHVWARLWRTPHLGELSMRTLRAWPLFYASMRIGSRLHKAHIRQVHAQLTPGMLRMILRLYRAADPEQFQLWEPRMLAATASIPCLVLWGEQDPYIPPWVADCFGARRVVRLPEAGHWVPKQAPERFAAEALAFLES